MSEWQPGQRVVLCESQDIPGVVEYIRHDCQGIMIGVRYWHNGERYVVPCYPDELKEAK